MPEHFHTERDVLLNQICQLLHFTGFIMQFAKKGKDDGVILRDSLALNKLRSTKEIALKILKPQVPTDCKLFARFNLFREQLYGIGTKKFDLLKKGVVIVGTKVQLDDLGNF